MFHVAPYCFGDTSVYLTIEWVLLLEILGVGFLGQLLGRGLTMGIARETWS